jgi:hypothetical protein
VSADEVQLGTYIVGEKPPPLVYQFLDSSGNPIDISTGYVADFSVKEADGNAFTGTATITGGTSGQVTYTWTGAEMPTAGRYTAYFWVGNGTTRLASIPIRFLARLPVGAVPSI